MMECGLVVVEYSATMVGCRWTLEVFVEVDSVSCVSDGVSYFLP